MSTQLPVPNPRRLPATATTHPGLESAARHTAHWRRPRLERVACLSYGRDRLAAAGGRVCCVWDTATHQLQHRITLEGEITALWIARDRSALAVVTGATVTAYDLATGAPRFGYTHPAEVASVHLDNGADVLASADVLGEVQVHDITTGNLISRIAGPAGRPNVYVHHGRYVLIGAAMHSVIIDAVTGEALRRFSYDPSESPPQEGLLLASTLVAHSGTMVRWFDCARFAPAHCVRNLGSTVQSIDLDEARGLALAATQSGSLHLFDLQTGAPRAHHSAFTSPVFAARFGPNASLYVAGGEALVMQLEDGRHVRSYCDESPPLVAMTAPPDRAGLVVSDRDGGVVQVDLRNGRARRAFDGCAGSVSAVTCNEALIATGSYDGNVRLLSRALNPIATIDLAQGPVQSIALDGSGGRAWVGTWSGKINCVDLDARQVVLTRDAFVSSVRTLALDPSRLRLCAGGDDGEIAVFEVGDGMHRVLAHHQPGSTYRAVFDDHGNLWTAAGDGVRRYHHADWMRHDCFPGAQIRWFELAGDRVYSLGLTGCLTVFDVDSGAALHRTSIEPPVNHRSIVALGADRIAIASADGRVRVFDAQLREVASLELLREGYLWHTPPVDAHPGWVHTNRPELLDIGERGTHATNLFAQSDPRRARHLAIFQSESHVMQLVGGMGTAIDSSVASAGNRLGGLTATHRLRWKPADR